MDAITIDLDAARTLYLAVQTAPASNTTIRAIAQLRLALIASLGEDRQRELIALWNELPRAQ